MTQSRDISLRILERSTTWCCQHVKDVAPPSDQKLGSSRGYLGGSLGFEAAIAQRKGRQYQEIESH